jgi:hypothetical protein
MRKFVAKKSTELEKEYKGKIEAERQEQSRRQQERTQAQAFIAQLESIPADQRGNLLLQNPQLGVQYQQARAIISAGGPSDYAVVERVWQNVRKELEQEHGLDLSNAKDIKEVIQMTSESLGDKKVEAVTRDFKEQLDALRTELMGQVQRNSPQPERGASTGNPVGGKRTYSRSEIRDMSLSDYRRVKEDIDAASREGRIRDE